MNVKFVIRNSYPNVPVAEVAAGEINDGTFVPDSDLLKCILNRIGVSSLVRIDDLFSGAAYASFKDVGQLLLRLSLDCHGDPEYYGNFIVFPFVLEDYVSTEEKEG